MKNKQFSIFIGTLLTIGGLILINFYYVYRTDMYSYNYTLERFIRLDIPVILLIAGILCIAVPFIIDLVKYIKKKKEDKKSIENNN